MCTHRYTVEHNALMDLVDGERLLAIRETVYEAIKNRLYLHEDDDDDIASVASSGGLDMDMTDEKKLEEKVSS